LSLSSFITILFHAFDYYFFADISFFAFSSLMPVFFFRCLLFSSPPLLRYASLPRCCCCFRADRFSMSSFLRHATPLTAASLMLMLIFAFLSFIFATLSFYA